MPVVTVLSFITVDCNTGEIRLVGGSDNTEGRVELCIEGKWNSVCGDHWGNSESYIVCSELGLVPSGIISVTIVLSSSLYGLLIRALA